MTVAGDEEGEGVASYAYSRRDYWKKNKKIAIK
jgi:hypothetical protein